MNAPAVPLPPPRPKAPLLEKLLDKNAAALVLTISIRTLERLIAEGKLPIVRIGAGVRIDPIDLRAFIDKSKASTSDT